MVNDNFFFRYSSYRDRLPYFAIIMVHDNWLLFLIFIFPNLQYEISTLWLLLHLNSETTSQHPIGIIDSRRRGPHNSKSDCVNNLYYMCEIESLQSLLIQYKHMYTQYSASNRYHCQELIYFMIWLFYYHPMNAQQILFQEFLKLTCNLQNQELWWMVRSISDSICDYYNHWYLYCSK